MADVREVFDLYDLEGEVGSYRGLAVCSASWIHAVVCYRMPQTPATHPLPPCLCVRLPSLPSGLWPAVPALVFVPDHNSHTKPHTPRGRPHKLPTLEFPRLSCTCAPREILPRSGCRAGCSNDVNRPATLYRIGNWQAHMPLLGGLHTISS